MEFVIENETEKRRVELSLKSDRDHTPILFAKINDKEIPLLSLTEGGQLYFIGNHEKNKKLLILAGFQIDKDGKIMSC